MADSATTRNRFRKQSLGSNLNVWGDPYLNDNLDLIDYSLDGQSSVAISGASTTLSANNYAADESRGRVLIFSGTLAANSTVTIPSVQKVYDVINGCTMAGFTLTLKTASGVGASLPSGFSHCICDGTDTTLRKLLNYGGSEILNVGAASAGTSVPQYVQVTTAAEDRSMSGYRISSVGTATATHQAPNLSQMNAAIAAAGIPASAGAVLVSPTDTSANYLGAKVSGSSGILISTTNPSGNAVVNFAGTAFAGATGSTAGAIGMVPAPVAGDNLLFLTGAGTFGAASSVLEVQVFS